MLPLNTFLWRMEMVKHACNHANSCLLDIKAQTLILTRLDLLLPSLDEGERLRSMIPNCEIRGLFQQHPR